MSRDSEVREAIEALRTWVTGAHAGAESEANHHLYGREFDARFHEGRVSAYSAVLEQIAAILDRSSEAAPTPHRHRYGLVPVWKADRSAVESWWWCTDHPTGEWAKIEDDPEAAECIPASEAAPVVGLPEPLNVEALALAMVNTMPDVLDWEMHADGIAAEYARLTQTPALGTDGAE